MIDIRVLFFITIFCIQMFVAPGAYSQHQSNGESAIAVTVRPPQTSIQNPDIPDREGWKLIHNDEFNETGLDEDVWITWFPYTDDGSDQCAFCRTHGDENQVFLDRNVVIEDGLMKIVAKREQAEWFNEQRNFTSGMIHSRYPFGRGYYEVRAKLPEGEGFWPAIWTFGQIWSEVDIMEAGMQKPKRFHTTVHNGVIKKFMHRRHRTKHNLAEGFHTYAMEWDSTYIKFFFDDKEVWTLCKYSAPGGRNPRNCKRDFGKKYIQPVFPHDDEKLYLIIGMGIGNETTPFTGSPNRQTIFPNTFEVDYIRIWQRE